MSSPPDWTLLVQDLLSPAGTTLPGPVLALISYHLASLDANDTKATHTLVSSIVTSPSLWNGTASADSKQAVPLEQAQAVLGAVRNGVLYRLGLIDERNRLAWWAQSELGKWIGVVIEAVREAGARREVALVVLSGLLAGLQQAKPTRQHQRVLSNACLRVAEDAVVSSWSGYFLGNEVGE